MYEIVLFIYNKCMGSSLSSVDKYINQFEGSAKVRLIQLRELVQATVPDATEGIMYGLVGYKLRGKPLIYFGGFDHHIGLYATPQGHQAFQEELSQYKQGKGSVQFPLDQPLPLDLVKRIVEYRRESID